MEEFFVGGEKERRFRYCLRELRSVARYMYVRSNSRPFGDNSPIFVDKFVDLHLADTNIRYMNRRITLVFFFQSHRPCFS